VSESVQTFDYDNTEYFYVKACFALFLLFQLISWLQKDKLELHYNTKNPLMVDFVKKTNITTMWFRPHFLGLTPATQTL